MDLYINMYFNSIYNFSKILPDDISNGAQYISVLGLLNKDVLIYKFDNELFY